MIFSLYKYNRFLNAILPQGGVCLLLCLFSTMAFAQRTKAKNIKTPVSIKDSIPNRDSIPGDTSLAVIDSVTFDFSDVNISEQTLDAAIDYESQDSMVYDIADEKIHLYGNATVKYGTITLTGDYIVFDWAKNTVTAQYVKDSLAKEPSLPTFVDGDQTFSAKKMKYNFKTSKGIIYDVSTKQSNLFVLGTRAKFTSKDSLAGRPDDIVYSQDAIFTTCDDPHPHYGIRSKKQKMIPNKLIVVGPSNLEIGGVPTPLWLPFGFFPASSKKRNKGLIFPKDYEYSQEWGFGLRDVGYYTPLNEYMDLTLTGDIYFNGTWGLQAATRFKRRYKYSGSFSLAYSNRKQEVVSKINVDGALQNVLGNNVTRSWSIRGSLTQAAGAHPTINIGGSLNIQTNNYNSLNRNDAQSVLQQNFSSNFSYRQSFPGRPFNLSASFSHSQNTRTGKVTVRFPTLDFTTKTIYPFKRKGGSGKPKWYEKINYRYKFNAQNQFIAQDSTLFTRQTLEEAQFGAKHEINSSASFRILKYFNFTPSANYKETWYFKNIQHHFTNQPVIDSIPIKNPDGSIFSYRLDTLATGVLDTVESFKWRQIRQYDFSASIGTTLFGMLRFKKGPIRGIRHVMKPNISFGYSPEYAGPQRGYYDEVENPDPDIFDPIIYSTVQNPIYGRLPDGRERLGFNISVQNNIEAKYYSKRDSIEKKIKIFDNINVNTAYNAIADSLKWSTVRASGTTRFFKGISTLSIGATWDPYIKDYSSSSRGRRINTTVWKNRKRPLRFETANFRLSTNMTVGKIRDLFKKKKDKEEKTDEAALAEETDPSGFGNTEDDPFDIFDRRDPFARQKLEDKITDKKKSNHQQTIEETEFISLIENFRIRHDLVMNIETPYDRDTLTFSTHSLSTSGMIPLTKKWQLRVGNIGYDFVRKQLTYPDFGITRGLHCWNMSFNWQPTRHTFSFTIQVSSAPLNFLKVPYQRNNADGFRRR
ncbi:MAG TPA: LPS-assembly protein LptD [Saprospiraceae bacterium]|nr:LPS-assembly protein LptD [Saprospiraceae bacterium]